MNTLARPPHPLACGDERRRSGVPALRSSPRVRAIYVVSILMACALALVYLAGLAHLLAAAPALALAAGLFLGALGADLITAMIHWACDTWGSEETAWVGAVPPCLRHNGRLEVKLFELLFATAAVPQILAPTIG